MKHLTYFNNVANVCLRSYCGSIDRCKIATFHIIDIKHPFTGQWTPCSSCDHHQGSGQQLLQHRDRILQHLRWKSGQLRGGQRRSRCHWGWKGCTLNTVCHFYMFHGAYKIDSKVQIFWEEARSLPSAPVSTVFWTKKSWKKVFSSRIFRQIGVFGTEEP